MGTPTGDYSVDFSIVATANPYAPANFTEIDSYRALQTVNGSGVKPTGTGSHPYRWYYNGTMQASPSAIRSKVEVGAHGSSDVIYALVTDTSGNGYVFYANSTNVGIAKITGAANSAATTGLKSGTITSLASGDILELEYIPGTKALNAYQNGTIISALSTSDSSYTPTTFGFAFEPGNSNATYMLGFAGDGAQTSVAYSLSAAAGYFSFTGEGAARDMAMPTTYGAYSYTGFPITSGFGYNAPFGNFGLTGYAATLAWSGAVGGNGITDNGTYRKQKIYELSSVSGLRRWVDYIPVQFFNSITPDKADRYSDDGALTVQILTSVSGLRAWVDYTPVYITSDPIGGKWRYDDDGFLPVVKVV